MPQDNEKNSSTDPLDQDTPDTPLTPEVVDTEPETNTEVLGSEEAQTIVNSTNNPDALVVDTPPAPKPKSKKPLVIVLLILAVMLIGGGTYYWFMLREDGTTNTESTATKQVEVQRFGVAVGLLEGVAEYSTDDAENWEELTAEVDLKEGDYVRTAADGRVVLLIDDGSAVRLAHASTVELTSLATDSVIINNVAGEVYTRVTASTTRRFTVDVDGDAYTAKGTAYRTTNTEIKKGVEVYHSAVTKDTTEVTEGNAYFTISAQKEKENKVSAIDLSTLKSDEFIKWNSEQDKKEAEFATALGVLVELDKPDPTPPPVAPTTPTTKSGISLSGSVSGYSAVFSWKATGVNTSQGYKLVKSKTSQTPTYPADSAAYVEAGKNSYNLYLGDGQTYYYRICAYRGNTCDSYSNTVTLTTPVKEIEKPTSGAVNLSIVGNVASWTFAGTAPHGFKLVISQAPNVPSYGNALKINYTGSPHTINYLDAGTYNVRVCKYTADNKYEGGCMDYSNQVEIIVP